MKKVEWMENRCGELFYVVAEETLSGWEFFDKSIWEIRWYPVPSTATLVAKANSLAQLSESEEFVYIDAA